LVELLIVIAIIAVLAGLTLSAVFRVLGSGPKAEAQYDIRQLGVAIGAFQTEFGVDYIPSYFVLREDGQYNTSNPAHQPTIKYFQKLFGKRFNYAAKRDWNNDSTITQGDIVLEGHHCLVFFLGGIPAPAGDGCYGFSTDNANPDSIATVGTGAKRRGPFFEF